MLLAPRPDVGGEGTNPLSRGGAKALEGVGVAGGVALTSVGRGRLGGSPRLTLSQTVLSKSYSRRAAPSARQRLAAPFAGQRLAA